MKRLGFIGLLVLSSNAQAAIIYSQGFEEGKVIEKKLKEFKDNKLKISCSNGQRFSVQDKVKRSGKYAAYLSNKGSELRCEWVSKKASGGHFDWGKEYWVGFSFNIPFIEEDAYNIYYQHHSQLSTAGQVANCQYTGNGFTIRRRPKAGKHEMVIDIKTPNALNAGGGNALHGTEEVYSWPLKLNNWNDFVLNFRYSDKSDGFIKVWHNGKLVINRSGSNVTLRDSAYVNHPRKKSNGKCGNLYKRLYSQSGGIYSGFSSGGVAYYDELKIGNANSSYEEVSPTPTSARSISNINTPPRSESSLTVPEGLDLKIN